MTEDKVKEFYEQVVKPNGYFADEQEFRTVVSDPNKSKEFFDNALKAEGVFNDYSEFETVLGGGLKKNTLPNESTTPSQQPTTPSATSTSENKKVTTEFGEPAVMLEEVEIKPKPEIGYLQSFMEGIASYDDLQVGYDVLRSGDKNKIIDYYNTRYTNSLNQTPSDNFIKNALRTIGGTVPMMGKVATGGAVGGAIGSTIPVVGTAVGAASGTIAEGIYEGQKLSKSSAFEEAYFEAKSQNKTDDEAFEIANNVSKVAQIAGGVEGGISGLAGGTATKAGTSALKNIVKEIIADAAVGATAAGARRGTENIAAQQQGLERKTTAGISEEMTGEAAFSFGLGLLLSPITQSGNLIGNRRKKIITAVAATDAPKAITIIDKSVEKGDISQEDGDVLKGEIIQTAKAFDATPESMPYEEREALTPTVAERQKLQKELEKSDDLTKPFVKLKIDELGKKVAIPLPTKYIDTAGQNTSELKDGQLYITRKGDVRMWDAAQKQFLEPPKSFEVEAKKETEQVEPTEEAAPQPQVVAEQVSAEPQPVSETQADVVEVAEPLKDVESTAKALESLRANNQDEFVNDFVGLDIPFKQENINAEMESDVKKQLFPNEKTRRKYAENTYSAVVRSSSFPKILSEAYHKAKADGSNPELVKAVEQLLGQKPSPSVQVKEGQVATQPTAEIDQFDAEVGSKTYKQKSETYPKGRTREKTLPDGTKLKGTFKVVSADDVLASHNEQTFAKTEGFPTNEKGKTVNDRDYETDKAAQSEVVRIASNLDERAVSQTPIVTKDGIVVDGNNRTMSRKLAAKQGTDKAYIDALKADADMYGIDPSEIDGVKNPMLVFEAEQKIPYTTKEFARFNKAEKKEKSPVEKAVELSKTISDRARRILGGIYEGAATPSEVTSNKKSMSEIRDLLISEGILQQNELPRYINPETGTATKEGVSFLETLLIGTSLDENTIRMLDNEGMGNAREKVLKAVVQITQNAALGENSLQSNIENGVKLLNKAKQSNQSVVDAVSQMDMFEVSAFTSEDLAVAVLLDGSGFKDFLKRYNSEVGTESLFEGTLTKEKIIDTLLSQKIKNYEQVRKNLRADAKQGQGAVSKVDGGDSGKAEPNIFDQYDNTKGASKKDKVIEQLAKESGKDKAERVRDIIDNFDAIKSRLQELISEGKIDNIEIRC